MKKIIIIILLLIILYYIYSQLRNWQSRNLNTTDDNVYIKHKIQNNFTVNIPKSFIRGKVGEFAATPIGDVFHLHRALFSDWGGNTNVPVILSIMPAENYSQDGYDWDNYVGTVDRGNNSYIGIEGAPSSIIDMKILKNTDTLELREILTLITYGQKAKILVYTDKVKKYQIGVVYWEKYLTDTSANKLLDSVVSYIQLTK